jgi:hypothetical protein
VLPAGQRWRPSGIECRLSGFAARVQRLAELLAWPGVPVELQWAAELLAWPGVPVQLHLAAELLAWPGAPVELQVAAELLAWPGVPVVAASSCCCIAAAVAAPAGGAEGAGADLEDLPGEMAGSGLGGYVGPRCPGPTGLDVSPGAGAGQRAVRDFRRRA